LPNLAEATVGEHSATTNAIEAQSGVRVGMTGTTLQMRVYSGAHQTLSKAHATPSYPAAERGGHQVRGNTLQRRVVTHFIHG
jgi:hypothetical protein